MLDSAAVMTQALANAIEKRSARGVGAFRGTGAYSDFFTRPTVWSTLAMSTGLPLIVGASSLLLPTEDRQESRRANLILYANNWSVARQQVGVWQKLTAQLDALTKRLRKLDAQLAASSASAKALIGRGQASPAATSSLGLAAARRKAAVDAIANLRAVVSTLQGADEGAARAEAAGESGPGSEAQIALAAAVAIATNALSGVKHVLALTSQAEQQGQIAAAVVAKWNDQVRARLALEAEAALHEKLVAQSVARLTPGLLGTTLDPVLLDPESFMPQPGMSASELNALQARVNEASARLSRVA